MTELDDDYAYVEAPGPKWKFNKQKAPDPKPSKISIVSNYESIYKAFPKLEKDGETYLVVHAAKFAEEYGLNRSYLSQLLNGHRTEVNGFKLLKTD